MRKTSARKGVLARGRIVVVEKDEIERIEATFGEVVAVGSWRCWTAQPKIICTTL